MDPAIQVHAVDADTYILRQNKCLSFEAPFMYLLFGTMRALLFDSGAEPSGGPFPLREVVDAVVQSRVAAGLPSPGSLAVVHSHGHQDHTWGDRQFAGRPRTDVVGAGVAEVRRCFGLARWPEGLRCSTWGSVH